jgi:UDP-glucose 4-epimerase
LASVVGPAGVLQHSGHVTQAIVRNTYHVASIAMNQRARLVNVSTSEVYGGGRGGYCDEATPRVIKPGASARLEYAAAKLACEVSLENLARRGLLDAATVRPFNVAGARQLGQGGFVLPRFVGQALLGMPLTIFGNGKQVRAFTDVRDVVEGILTISEHGAAGEAYNVGNPSNRVTVEELSDKVLSVTSSQSEKAYVDPCTIYGPLYSEAEDKFPNADKLISLGWRPVYDVEATIHSMHQFMAALPPAMVAKVAGIARDVCDDSVVPVPPLHVRTPELIRETRSVDSRAL